MDFAFSEEQEMLRDAVRRFWSGGCGPRCVREDESAAASQFSG